MAKKMAQAIERLPPPNLVESQKMASKKIQDQIDKGKDIRQKPITSREELDAAETEKGNWSKYNAELLLRLFDNPTMADEYKRSHASFVYFGTTLPQYISDYFKDFDEKISRLESIRDRLGLIPEKISLGSTIASNETPKVLSQDIFIVHGHDEAVKEAVSRFVEKLGFKAIILDEQPNAGRTVIEKFEDYSNVGFAIVLLTPDDIGSSADKPDELKPRARQNVFLELGYFVAKLGRQNVCALYKDVEIPSDLHGVLYTSLDKDGAWRYRLAQEIKHAGYQVDLNKAIE